MQSHDLKKGRRAAIGIREYDYSASSLHIKLPDRNQY
jgi:hypothetical protein